MIVLPTFWSARAYEHILRRGTAIIENIQNVFQHIQNAH